MGGEFAHAVDRAVVKAGGTVRLSLQAYTYMLNGARDDGVRDAGEGPRKVVLAVRKTGIQGVGGCVGSFESSTRPVEGPKLDGYLLRIPDKPCHLEIEESEYECD